MHRPQANAVHCAPHSLAACVPAQCGAVIAGASGLGNCTDNATSKLGLQGSCCYSEPWARQALRDHPAWRGRHWRRADPLPEPLEGDGQDCRICLRRCGAHLVGWSADRSPKPQQRHRRDGAVLHGQRSVVRSRVFDPQRLEIPASGREGPRLKALKAACASATRAACRSSGGRARRTET